MLNLEKKINIIVDVNSYVHSSFHAYDPKLDIKGIDYRIIHGIMDALVGLTYHLEKIDELFLIFDPDDGSLYRESQYPLYKKNRPKTDEDLIRQRDAAKIIFKNKIGLPDLHFSGYEADDIIGSLAKELVKDENQQVVIVSPDKDIAQLVEKNIFLLRKWKNKTGKGYAFLDEQRVKEEFGVNPNQIPDWLALMGDTVDNLPGLKNVGKKKATEILTQYPSIEHLLSIAHHIDNESLKEKVLDAQSSLPLIKKLATIVTDLPIKEKLQLSLEYSEKVRSCPSYRENIIKLEKYFKWPAHYKEMFV